MARAPIHRV
ncbi:hypothetical protein E2C01_063631 [Portunus trituberculatus]|uniref:Uncharacterized protein n=1 Tax=Portunus trituberculatus TaxID=210409 RepID=A0A5B7HJI8_PORTR|nr:hypothetical protein [Portunus trituberculatus]